MFDAGSGFSSFIWNTGETTQQIKGSKAGRYIVHAQTEVGCRSADTVEIVRVFAKPDIQLNKDAKLCFGSERKLDAGSFKQYLCSSHQTGSTITIKDTGTYWVKV